MTNGKASKTIVAARFRPGRGFTLVELMTVVAIIMLLLTILLPTVGHVRTMFLAAKTQSMINLIHNGCYEYHSDTGEFPLDAPQLVEELTGKSDSDRKVGYGFRVVNRGKVYGPYGGTEQLRWETRGGAMGATYFIDTFDHPILYYRCTVTENENTGERTYSYPNTLLPDQPAEAKKNYPVRDYLKGPGGTFHRTDFVVISRGPDGIWEPLYEDPAWTDSDDISNFRRQQ